MRRARKDTDFGLNLGPNDNPRNKISVSDEAGDKSCRRGIINIFGRTDLLQLPAADHCDPIRHAQGLFLIVGYQDRCGTQVTQNLRHFPAHLRAEIRIQPVKRLIEKHHPWTGSECACKSDTLLLPP